MGSLKVARKGTKRGLEILSHSRDRLDSNEKRQSINDLNQVEQLLD